MSYPDSVSYLYSLGNELKAGAKLGLDRMRTLLSALRNPERGQRFVHVAGTNGKGSTSAMIASALQKAKFKTGLYTSPHLVSPVERIQINGAPVSEEEFAQAFDTVHRASEALLADAAIDAHPSYFETVTAMAFLLFKERCDISVIEVGLGGRLDATNVIEPQVSVITPVSFDHEAYLGNTIAAIASEKAGILRPAVPAVIAPQVPEAYSIFQKTGAPIVRSDGATLNQLQINAENSTFKTGGTAFTCPLAGAHQVQNAQTAIIACRILGVADPTMSVGISETKWPGRLEIIQRKPTFILDGAHNPSGAAMLAKHIGQFYSRSPVWLIYAAMRDKAIEEVTSLLFPLADHLILTAPNFPRALRPQAILDVHPHPNAVVTETVQQALELAYQAPAEATVFFTGSLFLVGEVKALTARQVP